MAIGRERKRTFFFLAEDLSQGCDGTDASIPRLGLESELDFVGTKVDRGELEKISGEDELGIVELRAMVETGTTDLDPTERIVTPSDPTSYALLNTNVEGVE